MLLCASLAAGCTKTEPYALSDADKSHFVEMARVPPAKPGGAPLIFGVYGCTLYKAVTKGEQIVDWRVTLRADWGGTYPNFLTACAREKVRYDGKYVHVLFCAQALGAGGGCANGGYYRSRDGEHSWEISQDQQHWETLPKYGG